MAGISGLTVKSPQPLAQTCKSTPALVPSFATIAAIFTVAPTGTREGAAGIKSTDRVVDELIVTGAVMLTWGSAVDVATTVTAFPFDGTGGAVYVAVAPLAV